MLDQADTNATSRPVDGASNDSQCEHGPLPTGAHRERAWIRGLNGELEDTGDDDGGPGDVRSRAADNQILRKKVGERFALARELSGMSQSEAAVALLYANSTQLSLVERGLRMPTHSIMLRASTVFAVSLDYLYSRSDEPDIDRRLADRQAAARHVRDLLERQAGTLVDAIHVHLSHDTPSSLAPLALLRATDAAVNAARKFFELNRDMFEEMRGGATLVYAIEELAQAMAVCRRDRERHERVVTLAMERVRAANDPQGCPNPGAPDSA